MNNITGAFYTVNVKNVKNDETKRGAAG